MNDFWWDIKYGLKRTAKHVFYMLLAVCWFACWYVVFALITCEWNINQWSDGIQQICVTLSVFIGFGYMLYRLDT